MREGCGRDEGGRVSLPRLPREGSHGCPGFSGSGRDSTLAADGRAARTEMESRESAIRETVKAYRERMRGARDEKEGKGLGLFHEGFSCELVGPF